MANPKTFLHSGDLGDVIYALPTMQALGGGIIYLSLHHQQHMKDLQNRGYIPHKFPTGTTKYDRSPAGLTEHSFELVRPLLLKQPYISSVLLWNGESVDFDLNEWRTTTGIDFRRTSIAKACATQFRVDPSVCSSRWLSTDNVSSKVGRKIVISRSSRYQNERFPWRRVLGKYADDSVFVGTSDEHNDFSAKFIPIPFVETKDLLDLTRVIAASLLFVGNQSLPYAIAEGLKVATIQETCAWVPNCVYPRANAKYFFHRRIKILDSWSEKSESRILSFLRCFASAGTI